MSGPVVVYGADASGRLSAGTWLSMFRELWAARELTQRLVLRNFAAQFRQSLLGYVWIALPPVATAAVFSVLRQADVMKVPMSEVGMPYALFALIGTTIWGFFTQLSIMATASISNAGSLVSRVYFPREVLVLSAAGQAVINMVVRIGVVLLSFVLFGYAPHWQAVFAPLLLIPLAVFALGLGLMLAPINTMMNDISRALEFLFQFGMFLAPTVYPTPVLDASSTGWQHALFWVHNLNPVSHFIHAINRLIETGTFTATAGLIDATIISFLTLAIGWRFFHVCEPLLAERI